MMNTKKELIPIIGMEIHIELRTETKMFCGCSAKWFGSPENSQTCPVCLGLPGSLPVANQKAIEWSILLGLAYNCKINKNSKFDRKHYFYPDLPKAFQISQYDTPFSINGYYILHCKNLKKKIRIRRIHLEEDTGKLIHKDNKTYIDFNRAGVPLVEMVTEPDFSSSEEVKQFLEELQIIVRYLGISDADMEKGSMRLEPNISIKMQNFNELSNNNKLPPYKVEIKNINSFRFVKRAIDYEINRQASLLKEGKIPLQETRGFDEKRGVTYSQRIKEGEADYRYFPEPDIPPIFFTSEQIKNFLKRLPELPNQKYERFINKYHIKHEYAYLLVRDKLLANKFEDCILYLKRKKISLKNWEDDFAKKIVNKKINIEKPLENLINSYLKSIHKEYVNIKEVMNKIDEILKRNEEVVKAIKNGKTNAIQFLIGEVLRELKDAVNPEEIRNYIIKKIVK